MSTGTVKRATKANAERAQERKKGQWDKTKTIAKTPRQIAFKTAFTSPDSPTQGNALQSALQSGYSESYARSITTPAHGVVWLNNDIFRSEMLAKAERNLNRILDMQEKHGDTLDKDRLKIAQDTAKFMTERIGKRHYSASVALTGPDGGNLFKNDHIQAIDTTFKVID